MPALYEGSILLPDTQVDGLHYQKEPVSIIGTHVGFDIIPKNPPALHYYSPSVVADGVPGLVYRQAVTLDNGKLVTAVDIQIR